MKELADLKVQRDADLLAERKVLLELEDLNMRVEEARAATAATRKAITQLNEQLRSQYSEL